MKFRKNYEKSCSTAEPKCPQELQDYEYDKTSRKLVPTKKIEFYKEIQSYYESTRIDVKLKRFSMGDPGALGCPGGSYGDFTDLPSNLAEVLTFQQSAESSFSKLPADVRAIFNNNYAEFIASIEDGSYQQKLIDFARTKTGSGTDGTGTDGTDGTGTDVNGSK